MTRARGVADYGYYPPVNSNILINPSFTVNQYGDVIDHMSSTLECGPDRWKFRGIDKVGGTMNQTTTFVDPTTGVNKLLVKQRNATSFAYTYQIVEAVNIQGMYGKEMTFSFSYSDTGGSGIPEVLIRSYDSGATVKVLFEDTPASLGNNRWACTFTLSTEDGTIPDPSEKGMYLFIYPNEQNIAPAEWSVWETKLEVGSVATPFIARQYGEELALCQRYYQTIQVMRYGVMGFFRGSGGANSTSGLLPLPVVMRADPTGSTVSSGNVAYWIELNSSSRTEGASTIKIVGFHDCYRFSSPAFTVNNAIVPIADYSNNRIYTLDAEL